MNYADMTTGLSLCTGTRSGYHMPCRGTLYKCVSCGHTGCKQTKPGMCTNQAFNVIGHCLKCGTPGAEALPS